MSVSPPILPLFLGDISICREGNQFKLIDHSTNGTFVNGARVKDVFLEQGDILIFAEGGPKVCFTCSIESIKPVMSMKSQKEVPFTIQFGPEIRSFKASFIHIGSDPSNDFVINHPQVSGHHAEIYFEGDEYKIRDVGSRLGTYLNGDQIQTGVPIMEKDILHFGMEGPRLRYLGSGRFAEVNAS